MMCWYGDGDGDGGATHTLITVSIILFLGLVIDGVALARDLGRLDRSAAARPPLR